MIFESDNFRILYCKFNRLNVRAILSLQYNVTQMKNWIIALLPCFLMMYSCTEEKVSKLTPAQRRAKIDSVVRVQQKEMEEMEAERLKDRMSIELKEKTDSILAERNKKSVPAIPVKQDTRAGTPENTADTNQKQP